MTRLAGLFLTLVFALAAPAAPANAQVVSFPGIAANGQPLTLTARLSRPNGAGPFPAIVLMHGCSGLRQWGNMWGERLVRWGYVVLRPDSFGARGMRNCGRGTGTVDVRAGDAEAARRYLAARRDIDGERIGLMGMSHGGTASLIAVGGTLEEAERTDIETFGAVVALYPRCYQARSEAILAPILILIGQNDHLAPPGTCSTMATRGGANGHALDIVVYPRATHAFDWEKLDMMYFGQRIRYNKKAARDAVPRVRAFFELNLNGK